VRRLAKRSVSRRLAAEHYGPDLAVRRGRDIRRWAIDSLVGQEVVVAVLEGARAVRTARDMVGHNIDPTRCRTGTIRRDFGQDSVLTAESEMRAVRNLVHASDSVESASREIAIWFPEESASPRQGI